MRRIWLASYPKSGNTWMRALIANIQNSREQPYDINQLAELSGMASARWPFDYFLLIDSSLLTADEADVLRPRVYDDSVRALREQDGQDDAQDIRFDKVHDAYTRLSNGEPLLGGRCGAEGAVLIVRDPRDVACSLANHNARAIDDEIAFLSDPGAGFAANPDRMHHQFRQKLPGWSDHCASWLDQGDIPVHLVRYEDLIADTAGILMAVLQFAGQHATRADVDRAVAFSRFETLKAQEEEVGFREAPRPGRDGNFFRQGRAGMWQNELTEQQVERIEAGQAGMMARLGYQLSTPGDDRTTAGRGI